MIEEIIAVYDATGAGTGFIGVTNLRVVLQDNSFVGKKVALTSIPYSRVSAVLAAARSVPAIIEDESGRRPYGLKRRCTRVDTASFECRVAWQTTRKLRASTRLYNGDMTMKVEGEDLVYDLDGLTVTAGCLQRRPARKCVRGVRW